MVPSSTTAVCCGRGKGATRRRRRAPVSTTPTHPWPGQCLSMFDLRKHVITIIRFNLFTVIYLLYIVETCVRVCVRVERECVCGRACVRACVSVCVRARACMRASVNADKSSMQ